MRKLATIREISDIKSIPDADKIEVAKVDGWEVVVSKNDGFKIGDKVIYIEIDSKMPEIPEYEFLKSRKYVVKTIKLRGQISQGLILPLTVLPDTNYKLGRDVTDVLGIVKYDPELEKENEVIEANKKSQNNPIIKYFLRFAWFRKIYIKPNKKETFPSWIRKTDEERIQNMPNLYRNLVDKNIKLTVTEKVDGCSGTYFLRRINKRKYEFGVCSRNQRLVTPDNSCYWKVANFFKIKDALKDLIGENEWIVLQGEITGEKIQGNKYHDVLSFWAFNLITPEKRYDTDEMSKILAKYAIFTVPIYTLDFRASGEIADMVEYTKGKSQIVNREREGFVFRNIDENISFKCINPLFLLKNDV